MPKLVLTLALALSATAAQAVDYRWTQGYGQGTLEAAIVNKAKDELRIYCASGQQNRPVGMFLTIAGRPTSAPGKVYVQFVVDGKNHPFTFEQGRYNASGRGFYGNLHAFVEALVRSKSPSFAVELPEEDITRSLSLLNAADALGTPPDLIIKDCR